MKLTPTVQAPGVVSCVGPWKESGLACGYSSPGYILTQGVQPKAPAPPIFPLSTPIPLELAVFFLYISH